MDPIRQRALEMALVRSQTADTGAIIAQAEAYEAFLRGASSDGPAAFEQGAEPDQAPPKAVDQAEAPKPVDVLDEWITSPEAAIGRAQEALTDALAEYRTRDDHSSPELRDFLNAEMPEWLALAADREMKRQAGLIRNQRDRLAHNEQWTRFVRTVAAHAGRTNSVRFPPDV